MEFIGCMHSKWVSFFKGWSSCIVGMDCICSFDECADFYWLCSFTLALPIAFSPVVAPYPYTYSANTKKQWANRTLLDDYCKELGNCTELYSKYAIKSDKSQLIIVSKICSILFKIVIVCLIRFIGLSQVYFCHNSIMEMHSVIL